MKTIFVQTTIDAPHERAFELFTDLEKMPQILHSAHFVEFRSPNTQGLGAKWIQKSGDIHDPTEGEHEIVTYDSPHSFTMTTNDKVSTETMRFTFTPVGSQTVVEMSVSPKVKGCLVLLLAPFMRKHIQQSMQEDLDRMKTHIESQTASL